MVAANARNLMTWNCKSSLSRAPVIVLALCLLAQVINENLGIAHGCITTIHNITGTQPITDLAMSKKKVSMGVLSRSCVGMFALSVQMAAVDARRGGGVF